MSYRTAFVPETDDEIEALADLARLMRGVKLWTIIPLVLLTALAMGAAIALHVSGGLALFPLADGSYYVSKGSICAVAALSGVFTFIPVWVIAWLVQKAAIAEWRRSAAQRFKLDREALSSLERMFA